MCLPKKGRGVVSDVASRHQTNLPQTGNSGHEIMVDKLAQTGRLRGRQASMRAERQVTEILLDTKQRAQLSTDLGGRSRRVHPQELGVYWRR